MSRVPAENLLRSHRRIEGALRPSAQSVAATNYITHAIDIKGPAALAGFSSQRPRSSGGSEKHPTAHLVDLDADIRREGAHLAKD
jgi:hypothetical protein